MNFYFEKNTNVEIDKKYYGIIASTIYTYDGVFEIIADDINWEREEVIFSIDQPCKFVSCGFEDVNKYVFKTEELANEAYKNMESKEGLQQW